MLNEDVGSATRTHSLIAGGAAVMNLVMFAAGFVPEEPDIVLGAGAAVAATIIVAIVGSVLLRN